MILERLDSKSVGALLCRGGGMWSSVGAAPASLRIHRFMTEEQYGWRVEAHAPKAIRILDTEDLHCLRYACDVITPALVCHL